MFKIWKAGLPSVACRAVARIGARWCRVLDAFRNNEIKFSLRLQHIQTVFRSFKIELRLDNR